MTTIAQLPPATTVGASDLLPLSQSGLLYSVTVSQLTANMQTLISVPTGDLLGRQSVGAGAPESIGLGTGLALNGGTLAANGADHASFPVQSAMSLSDEIVISANSAPGLLPVTALRGLFSAGTGVSIDGNGVITVTASAVAGPAGPQGASRPYRSGGRYRPCWCRACRPSCWQFGKLHWCVRLCGAMAKWCAGLDALWPVSWWSDD